MMMLSGDIQKVIVLGGTVHKGGTPHRQLL